MLRFWGSNRKRFRPFAARCVRGVVLLALLLALAMPGWALDVSYLEGSWDDTTKTVKYTTQTADAYTVVTDQTTNWTDGGWYVVNKDVTIATRVTVTGTVNLILCDGATLKAEKGITVATGNTLNIYGQIAGTGQLEANGDGNNAGIGGGFDGGTVTIHGGVVTATSQYAAGIGGGNFGNGGPVTVYGGVVTAISNSSAGIGGVYNGDGGPVTVYGGTVTAKGGGGAAGIGGGGGAGGGNGGPVTIHGGVVTATGNGGGAGIGKGNGGVKNGTLTVGAGVVVYGGDTANTMKPLYPDDEGEISDRPQYMIAVGPVAYRYTEDNGVTWENGSAENATLVTGGTMAWSRNNWWYFVAGNVTIDTRIEVSGTVNLILCDGATLKATAGIAVEKDNTLNIYGQTAGTGKLVATGGENVAGIGGNNGDDESIANGAGGTVTIHGGVVEANGGNYAAGIGGGLTGNGGEVTIYGGTVMANGGGGAAGIGGAHGRNGGTVMIYGGVVTAKGKGGGAGIGGGIGGNGDTVTITGGTVIATGGGEGVPGIGRGADATDIGAGKNDDDGTLTVGTGVALFGGKSANPGTPLDPDDEGKINDRKQYMTAVAFVPVTEVTLVSKDVTLAVGETGSLIATVSPANALSKDVVWSSSNPAVASVDKNGKVTGQTVGTATITVTATNGLTAAFYHVSADCRVKVTGLTPALSDFVVTLPQNRTYDGTAKAASVAVKNGVRGMGQITVEYWRGTTQLTGAPTNAGDYTVKLNVAQGTRYEAAELTDASWKFTINKADIQPSVSITGWTYGQAANAPSVSSNPGSGTVTYAYKVKDAADSTYSATVPSAVGSYTVRATVAETANYNGGTATADFTISAATDTDNNGNNSNSSNSGNNGNNTGSETVSPDKEPDPELTPEEQKAVEEAQKKLDQDTKQKAAEAEEAAKTVDTRTEGGRALADLMSGNAQGSTKEIQAAALEVKEALEETGTDLSTLTAHDVEMAVQNKAQARQDKVDEVNGKVKDPKVPAATDLLTEYGSNTDLQEANEKLTVQPKLVQPEVLSDDAAKQAKGNIAKAATGEQKVAEGVNFDAVQAANRDGLKTSADITIEPASKDLGDQTKAVEKVFNAVSADLAGANEGKGVVIATVLPKMTPKASGFFPLRVNLRHLMPGRRLRFWPSAAHFKQASGKAAVSLAAAGQEGDHFFLDENGVPTATVSGDASKMTAVAYLTAGTTYEDAFITVDATSADQPALTDLAEKANPNPNPNGGENSPTSNKGSGGCDAGLGGVALLALAGLVATKKH